MRTREIIPIVLTPLIFNREVRNILTEPEQGFFCRAWLRITEQLGTITPTDELTIKDVILFDIFCFRAQKEICRLRGELEDMWSVKHFDLGVYRTIKGRLSALNNEILKNQAEKDKQLRSLKVTRDVMFKNMVDDGVDFFSMLKELDEVEKQKKLTRWANALSKANS